VAVVPIASQTKQKKKKQKKTRNGYNKSVLLKQNAELLTCYNEIMETFVCRSGDISRPGTAKSEAGARGKNV
jgi:hypothetical protein